MIGLPWFKCDPVALNDGYAGLTLSQRGAYSTILNCIYAQGGPVRDNAGYFSAVLGCSRQEWAAIRRVLTKLGKLHAVVIDQAHYLTNPRAEREIAEYRIWIEKSRRGGQASARARGHRPTLQIVGQEDD